MMQTHSNIPKWLKPLNNVFHQRSSSGFHRLNWIVWVLVLSSIVLLFWTLYLGDGHPWAPMLENIDQLLIGVFTIEYILRILSYHPPIIDVLQLSKWHRIRSHVLERLLFAIRPLNLVDLLTIMGGTPALRALRVFRMLRLFRIAQTFDLLRYSNPFYGVLDAYEKNQLLYAFGFFIVLSSTVLGGTSIYMAEHHINDSINHLTDGLWWAMVTLTTVGYGDIYPVTSMGRLIGGTLMIVGMFTLALFAGIVGQTLLSAVLTLREEQFRMSGTMNHLVICGYSPGARLLLTTLEEEFDFNTLTPVIFAPYERPADIPLEYDWIQGDPTKEYELDKVRLAYAEACIVVADQHNNPQNADARTILTVFTLRSYLSKHPITQQREYPLTIAVEILEDENIEHAKTAGANEIVASTRLGYSMLSHSVMQRGSAKILNSILSAESQNLYVLDNLDGYPFPKRFDEVQLDLKRQFGILVIGVRSEGNDFINPPDDIMVKQEDGIVYLGPTQVQKAYIPVDTKLEKDQSPKD